MDIPVYVTDLLLGGVIMGLVIKLFGISLQCWRQAAGCCRFSRRTFVSKYGLFLAKIRLKLSFSGKFFEDQDDNDWLMVWINFTLKIGSFTVVD